MEKLVDIHCHVLPAIDDGSKSIEQSISMLRIAASENIGTMVLTPHYHPAKGSHDISKWNERLEQLRQEVVKENIPIDFYLGCEVFFTHEAPQYIEEGRAPSISGSDYVLVEFRPETEYSYIKSALYDIQSVGKNPIIAHIERYMCINGKADRVEELSDKGAIIQVNASSIVGDMGFSTKHFLKKLLKHELIDVIGTDAHSDGHRAPRMLDCFKYISKKYGEEYAYLLMRDNALKIIANEEL